MKKKLFTIIAIVIAVPLIMFFTLVLYFAFFDDEEASTKNDSLSEINNTDKSDESNNNSDNNQSDSKDTSSNNDTNKIQAIFINDVDVTSKLEVKEIDSIMYANAKSYVEAFTGTDMNPDMCYFNYEHIKDKEAIQGYLLEYDKDGNSYLEDKYSELVDLEAILISSWFSDAPLYLLFIDSMNVVKFGEELNEIISIDKAPKIINNEVYLPIEAIANMLEFEVRIEKK